MCRVKLEILSKDQLGSLHLASLDVMEHVGFKIPSEETLKLCQNMGAEVNYSKQVAKIPSYLVEECIRKSPHKITLYDREMRSRLPLEEGRVHFGTCGAQPGFVDLETGEYRRLTQEDLARITRLADILENVDWILTMGSPADVPQEIAELYSCLITFENARKHVVTEARSKANARAIIKMGTVIAGEEEKLRETPIMTAIYAMNSPLFYGKNLIESMMEMASSRIPVWVETGPMAGANGPVTLAGTLVLNNAEILGALVLTKLIDPRSPFIYGSWARTMDMRTGAVVFGGPEFGLLRTCNAQLAEFYNIPSGGGGVLCDAKSCDMQAGYEKMLTGLLPALGGLNLISGMGMLGSELYASCEDLVIDNEMVGMMKRVLKGLDFRDETLAVDAIRNVGIGGHFLANKHTLKYAEQEHWIPKISDRLPLESWIKKGSQHLSQIAKERARQLLSEPKVPSLPEEISSQLRKIIKGAEKDAKSLTTLI